jgi:hypothetical protein
MVRKLIQFMMIGLVATGFLQTVSAQGEKETEISSISGGRNRTIEIRRSGNYRLSEDVSVRSGDGIVISASNVTLNLNGNSVTTEAGGTGRGIFVNGVSGVSVRNGKVGGFNSNVMVANSVNVNAESLQIVGGGLAPNNGPTEIGVQIVNSRSVFVSRNNISSVNLGVFVRGGNSAGNRIFENVIVGGGNPANNLLGICYNPAVGGGTAGPRGDNIYNNHIARFGFAIAISAGSLHNIFNENTLASFNGGFREPEALRQNGGTNVSEGNIETTIPADVLP